jgi:hypothetical protein
MRVVRKRRPKMGKEEDIAMFELCKGWAYGNVLMNEEKRVETRS